jgi:glycosyltransferase involved in cell wall biosynthesis
MKIFYLARLFSGLESSFISKQWSPTGIPTIYRVIEKIDETHEPCFIFTAKDSGPGCFSLWHESNDKKISINGLNHDVTIVSGIDFFPAWFSKKIRVILREIRQTVLILYKIYKFKPNVLYCDHANVIIAAIFSRIQKHTLVVFRVMGVNQFMRTSLSGSNIYHRIYSWAYRSPFSLVICTQDGSGVEKWTSQALSESVKTEILLNGTDYFIPGGSIDPMLSNLPSDKVIIMFVGKLEKYKGCYEFVQGVLNLVVNKTPNIHALIIGSGTEEKKIVELVSDAGASNFFTFIKLLPHSQILHAHSICDIYVSMNHLGNLSNANLEAIQSNDCMIISTPQESKGIDEVTASLLGESVITVPINQPDKLSDALSILISSKSKREAMSQSIREIKKSFIWSWDDRINIELDIIKKLERGSTEKE